MKINILRNPGRNALAKLSTTDAIVKTLVEGATVDVDQKLATELIKLNLAEPFGIKAVPPERAAIEGREASTRDVNPSGDFKKLDDTDASRKGK